MDNVSLIDNYYNANAYIELSFDESFTEEHNTKEVKVCNKKQNIEKKPDSIIFKAVKFISQSNFFIKFLVLLILINPFIKLSLYIIGKNNYLRKDLIDLFVSRNEKKIITTLIVFMLLVFNLFIIFSIHEYNLRVLVFFINNIYLLIFVINTYFEEFRLENMSWNQLINKLNNKA